MELARDWLAECSQKHSRCGPVPEAPLPTPVLDLGLGSSDAVRLRELKGHIGRYLCLSYCWGRLEFLKTTRDNFERHKQGINPEELPRTFRDAIMIARALGVRYLWIDALCIIQDDVDDADWKRESATMADIYRRSYLTLAPTWARSAHAGFFSPPEDGGASASIGPVTVHQFRHFPTMRTATAENLVDFPVLTRAWTYQERMLAPRVLHFCRQEILWECRERSRCECGGSKYEEKFRLGAKENIHTVISRHCGWLIQRTWRRMIMECSPLALTYPTDKLPAFGGLAEAMRRRTGQEYLEYLAGLWRDTLILDMCWHRDPRVNPRPSSQTVRRRPTWSWASVDNAVMYQFPLWESGVFPPNLEQYAEVLDAGCSLAGPSPTGPVHDGFVELMCSAIRAYPAGRNPAGWELRVGSAMLRFYLDWGTKLEEDGEYYLIPMLTIRGEHNYHLIATTIRVGSKHSNFLFYGLVVRPNAPDSKEMVRVGLAWEDWISDSDLQEMVSQEKRRVRIV
ncbi:77a0289c-5977-4b4b-aa69-7e20f3972421 [Thermothielavioides terrestris]|uniref:77a0289c-5977-4b4b-aa69-7e20f3972421 n=1 Tax=Thermothielavioides terrestris TaxID=2587410 RepID=A0A446BQU8_9PEZI|nr:77a0289c-5977-4b4b-aa69-7e20f3972421 [Thermothielavioides terrestris]